MKIFYKNKNCGLMSRKIIFVLFLFLVSFILVSSKVDALIKIVSTFIDMLGNDIYNVGNLNATGWLNSTYFNGTYYGNGSDLNNLNTFNATYDAMIALTSFANYNYTTDGYSTNSNTVWLNMPNLTLNLASTGISLIECDLMTASIIATTGAQLRVNLTGSSKQVIVIEYHSTATAVSVCQAITNLTCSATGTTGVNTIFPSRINVESIRSGSGQMTIELKSEISASMVNVTAGSWCRSIEK